MLFLENLISGSLPFCFLLFSGIYLSVKTRFSQITRFSESLKLTFHAFHRKGIKKQGVTSYQAACTALCATVGTGNIAGVAGALSIGGAGAIFWMWISAILGTILKSAEITLAVLYREKKDGDFVGGPMYYIKNGLGGKLKILGTLFCLAAIPAVMCSGNMTQTNSAIGSFCQNNIQKLIFGIIFCVACFFVITGNFRRIAAITEKLVPFMSVLYIAVCGFVIIKNMNFLPKAFDMIFEGAFNPRAVTGGVVGSIWTGMFIGSSRGVFSNEAGLGTSAMAHSVAVDADPKTQGLFGVFEVFVDTILLCTLTALTILCSGVKINYGKPASTELVIKALETVLGGISLPLIGLMMCLFGFSSIIGWAVYGKLCWGYLLGQSGNRIFTFIYPCFCILGALFQSAAVWRIASFCNGMMLIVNVTAILLLSPKIKNYLKRGKRLDKQKNIRFARNTRLK